MSGSPSSWTAIQSLYSGASFSWAATYVNGHWIATGVTDSTTDTFKVWETTDPRGTWTARLTDASSWDQLDVSRGKAAVWDGTYYVAACSGVLSSVQTTRVHYATDPTGTWSYVDLTGINAGRSGSLDYVNGYFVIMTQNSSTGAAMILYATSVTGTWSTVSFASAYSVANSVAYSGGVWYALIAGSANEAELWSASSLGGTWTLSKTFTGYANPDAVGYLNAYGLVLQQQDDGTWTFPAQKISGGLGTICYADALDGTWYYKDVTSDVTAMKMLLSVKKGYGYWVVSGPNSTYNGTVVGYSTSVDGTYTQSSSLSTSGRGLCVDFHAGEFIINDEEKIWAMTGGALPAPTTGPTYLRLHQSPVRTPSRVRPPQLRQRQRPETT